MVSGEPSGNAPEDEIVPTDVDGSPPAEDEDGLLAIGRVRPPARPLNKFISGLGRVVIFPMAKFVWKGGENLPHDGRGFIAAANHASELDSFTFPEFLMSNGIEPRVLAKRALFNTPIVGAYLRSAKMIPVDRGTDKATDSLGVAEAELLDGACIALFPEGTLTRDPDLWPMEGKTGVARLALATRAPVIPVGQWGAGDVLPRYSRAPRPFPRKTITIEAGPPVDLSDLYDRPVDRDLLHEATDRVMDAISEIVGRLRGETPPSPRFDLRLHPEYKKKQTTYPPVERP